MGDQGGEGFPSRDAFIRQNHEPEALIRPT